MKIPQLALSTLLALSAITTTSVDAHGILLKPRAQVRPESKLTAASQFDFVGEIEGKDLYRERNGTKLQWGRTPEQNQRQFADMFTATGYTTLRQFFQANDKLMKPRFPGKTDHVCGFTDMAATPSTLPVDGVLEWGHTVGMWGFQVEHHGPCEVWCDDSLVLRNENCRAAYGKELPARMPIEVAKCVGAKRLQFLWLAVHFAKWQYWMNCVPLVVTTPAPTALAPTTLAPTTLAPTTLAPTNTPVPTLPVATPTANGIHAQPVNGVPSAAPVATPSIGPSAAQYPVAPPAQVNPPKPCPSTGSPLSGGQQTPPFRGNNSPRQVGFGTAVPGMHTNVGGGVGVMATADGGPSAWLNTRAGVVGAYRA